MQLGKNLATSGRCIALVVLLTTSSLALPGQSGCSPTPLSQKEAEQLVLLAYDALAAKKIGGKLYAIFNETKDSTTSYSFMVRSTVSPPGAPIDNGLVGYYDVSKATGRVLNIALREEKGKELVALQRKLRSKHCVSPEVIKAEHDAEDYEHDDE